MEKNTAVAIEKCTDYSSELVYSSVKKVCSAAGFPDVRDKHVLIKPNILADTEPERAITTHPEVLRAVIRMVLEGGGHVQVGDSPPLHRPSFNARKSGIRAVCEQSGVEWVDFSQENTGISVSKARAGLFHTQQKFLVAKAVVEADLIISLPKMKTHQLLYMTGAVKNMFGVIPGLHKGPYHVKYPDRRKFSAMLLDLFYGLPPVFSIMDAITAMEGPGPNNGYPIKAGLILASSSAINLDIAAAHIMGYNPSHLPLFQQALSNNHITGIALNRISFPLLHPDNCVIKDFTRISVEEEPSLFKTALFFLKGRKRYHNNAPKPVFDDAKCIMCGMCIQICPNNALKLKTDLKLKHEDIGGIAVNYNKCIRCYCCHEVCPHDAINLE